MPPTAPRTADYILNATTFRVTYGDLTAADADALVSSDDNYLSMGGGVSMALLRAGGDAIRYDARKHTPVELGDAVVTTAGALPAKYVMHAVTIDYTNNVRATEQTIASATGRRCFIERTFRSSSCWECARLGGEHVEERTAWPSRGLSDR